MKRVNKLLNVHDQQFDDTGLKKGVFSAPGRVNLIGEHTDYNDGYVLPMAIDKNIMMVAQLRDDKKVVVYDINYEPAVSFSLDKIEKANENTWINYLMGVAQEIENRGHNLQGMNIVMEGNVPLSSGLSSSAALEIVTAITFDKLNLLNIDPVEIAVLTQAAENNFVGVNCGIMDQYISRLGKKDHALLIDCRTNDYELVPFTDDNYRIVICNTKVQRELVDSAYNRRRKECNRATNFFNNKLEHEVEALRDVSSDEFSQYEYELPEIVAKRAKHIISENARVLKSVDALKNNDFVKFGRLMIKSHKSLRDDYEVSCEELDLLVDIAMECEGVLGARMTGAGFGGCTVNLVNKNHIDKFKRKIIGNYKQETGINPEIYVSSPAEGAQQLKMNL